MRLGAAVLAWLMLAAAAPPAGPQGVQRILDVPPDYIARRGNDVHADVSEVYELANVMLTLTQGGQNSTLIWKEDSYYQDLMRWFGAHRNHPAIAAADFGERPEDYLDFREGANVYCFAAEGRIERCRPAQPHLTDRFTANLRLTEQFARDTRFREFFAAHRAYYHSLGADYVATADPLRMRNWLEANFDTRINALTLSFSPLIDGLHSTNSFRSRDGRYSEAFMFTRAPNSVAALPPLQRSVRLARTLFTEIDHNYVNPATSRNLELVDAAFGDRRWTGCRAMDFYSSPEAVFNEYMTWSAFVLYAKDNYDAEHYAAAREETVDRIVNRRGFPQFEAFLDELARQRDGPPPRRLQDLYPTLLAWSKRYIEDLPQCPAA